MASPICSWCRKTGCTQPRRHGIGRARSVTGRRDRVDLDKLLVNIEGELLLRRKRLGQRETCKAKYEHYRRRTPWSRKISATSRAGRAMIAVAYAGGSESVG
jgi:hypothetical protein